MKTLSNVFDNVKETFLKRKRVSWESDKDSADMNSIKTDLVSSKLTNSDILKDLD